MINHTIAYRILFTYLVCSMPVYLHGMESTEQKIVRRLEQLRTRKKHLLEDITLIKKALENHQKNKELGQQNYIYWQKKHPSDSMQDYANILEGRVNNEAQLLKDRQQSLNDVQQEIEQIDMMLKGEDKEVENGKNNQVQKTSFSKSEKM